MFLLYVVHQHCARAITRMQQRFLSLSLYFSSFPSVFLSRRRNNSSVRNAPAVKLSAVFPTVNVIPPLKGGDGFKARCIYPDSEFHVPPNPPV